MLRVSEREWFLSQKLYIRSRCNSAGRLLMRGYFRWQVVRFLITGRTLPTNPVSRFISAEAATRAASCVCAAPLTKDAPGSVSTA
jgi:hypothetical protein